MRAGWLPIFDEGNNKVLHAGINYRYGRPVNGEIKVRSRPEVNEAPFFVDTGTFPSDFSNNVGFEIYYQNGSFMMGSEVYTHIFHSPEGKNTAFNGGDIMFSYFITGESRPYSTLTSIFGFVPVSRSVFKGGPGAWEVLLRYSAYNLMEGNLQGGQLWRITPMVNWYLSNGIRLELAYGYGVLDRFQMKGGTQFFQSRIQFTLP